MIQWFKTPCFQSRGAEVQSLVRELRSYMYRMQPKNEKKFFFFKKCNVSHMWNLKFSSTNIKKVKRICENNFNSTFHLTQYIPNII